MFKPKLMPKVMPVARVSLPIRRPRRECFLALTDPETLSRFWLHDAGDSCIEEGAQLRWQFRADAPRISVLCREMRPDCLIRLELSNGVRIMLTLDRHEDGGTLVHYCECGFGADADTDEVSQATEGAARMLSALKTMLEPDVAETPDRPRLPTAA
ncbi:SRPBCC domain-containing protein [Pseudooceanicola nitratireducens]|jgi:uncharacterized protein YndB with AHSA1/START domain|uniref:Uncharacterized conserved protein YndB, AHSA1/START domain n=1 Tax=Pseudooceanicola nitratireducens TaxID=517719 RepID=A0A1I1NJZ5_9RHOB|nr:SRPBCC domain-containing protein [Pseudooceanicola nitratireducens]MEC7300601.1 SRPBCC domain-containing protein [Pseudomonadota bacterium]MBY6156252.1 SRPBCC domain-containing protein [Pseudooceanicola nitratireducens]MEC7793778.1 SRPBCC domain-containing protein [Pseudomonadota bacterium]SEI68782.1 Uncharacterized conserved protein YndB, AHSA1/START domain [Pseudooceanicola nitratireducens]SFC97857.1 Uncharacterized conserved protein YndB, AHSA1/START domain [Pseudooceanicola nitratireduc